MTNAAQPSTRYETLSRIASGGMATVFVGRARGAIGFSRLVALKVPHPFVAHDPGLREALEREARVASAIHHPHVVSVLDVEVRGEDVILVLDYVEGCSLSKLASRSRIAGLAPQTGVAVRVILDIASGLHAAHMSCDRTGKPLGIVHRDVSPQNVLVGLDGYARITDFGIAKIGAERDQTAPDVIKGKLGYMAPEYIADRHFDARSDQYALAVVAWEALAGARMFASVGDGETVRAILDGTIPKLSAINPALEPLDDVLARALARDPSARFESVAAFGAALEQRAREHGWVATHEEVGRVVEDASGAQLRERREGIEAGSAEKPAASARDEMQTVSLADAPAESKRPAPFALIAAVGLVLVVGVASVVGFLASSRARAPASVATSASSAPAVQESAAPSSAATIAPTVTLAASAEKPAPPATSLAPRGRTPPAPTRKRGVLFRDPG